MFRAARAGSKSSVGAQVPVAAQDAGGQAGVVGAHDADAVNVHTQQFGRPHVRRQPQGHVVTQPPSMYLTPSISRGRSAGKQALEASM